MVTWFIANADYGDDNYFNTIGPVLPDGSINPNSNPYWCWVAGNVCADAVYGDEYEGQGDIRDTRAEHTGDVYVYYKLVIYMKFFSDNLCI